MTKGGKGKEPRKEKAPATPPRGTPWWRLVLRFFSSPILWRFLLLIGVGVGIYYVASNIQAATEAVLRILGVGIVVATLALVAVILFIWRGYSPLLWHWRWWLGGFSFLMALWALLSFFYTGDGSWKDNLGGSVGQRILLGRGVLGGLWVAELALLGFLFVAPRHTATVVWFLVCLVGRLARVVARCSRRAWRHISRPRVRESKFTVHRSPRPSPSPVIGTQPPVTTEAETPSVEKVQPPPTGTPPSPSASAEESKPSEVSAEHPRVEPPAEEMWQRFTSQTVLTPSGWQLASIDILDKGSEMPLSHADNEKRAQLIEEALRSYGVETSVVEINVGPTVTQFGVEPGWDVKYKEIKEKDSNGDVQTRRNEVSRTRVKVERIASLANDLALALAAPTIRIEAPVPGKSVVGIEVPNTIMGVVTLRSVVETAGFQKLKGKAKLALALGKGAGGEAVMADLAKMPHLLIAGATGSGKTVCLNAVIACLLLHNTPEDVEFIMVDPKRVEMVAFNTIPHLVAPVVVDAEKAVNVLRWLLGEMDRRYKAFARVGARNIEDFSKKSQTEPLPYLVLVIDELADLMMTAYEEVERSLCRLAQLSRATGIHLVVATQRPSVDVITGLIKANFPTRISFATTSQVDSRTILDFGGAEKLLGKGDMLYMPTDAAKPRRLQGCFVSDQEIERLVYVWNSQKGLEAPLKVQEFTAPPGTIRGGSAEDPLLRAARRLAQEHRHISTSFLQRRLHVGFPRAARLMELLEAERSDVDEDLEDVRDDSVA